MKVIFDGAYSCAFTLKAIESQYADGIEENRQIETDYYRDQNRFKRKSLEMFLLADEVILVGADDGVDYDKLLQTGLLSIERFIIKDEHLWFKSPTENTDLKSLINLLKPWFIQHILASLNHPNIKRGIADAGLSQNEFVEVFFEDILGNPIDDRVRIKAGVAIWHWQPMGCKMYSSKDLYLHFKTTQVLHLVNYMVDLYKISNSKKALLCTRSINKRALKSLDTQFDHITAAPVADAYGILMTSLTDIIGYMPRMHSITQVLYLKDKKIKEIKNLNSALKELQFSLHEGRPQGINKSKDLIELASKDLSWGVPVTKVGNWITFNSLPVGIIETITGFPPILGLSLASVGIGGVVYNHLFKNENWMSLYR